MLQCSNNLRCISCVIQEQNVKGNNIIRALRIVLNYAANMKQYFIIEAVCAIIVQGNKT